MGLKSSNCVLVIFHNYSIKRKNKCMIQKFRSHITYECRVELNLISVKLMGHP